MSMDLDRRPSRSRRLSLRLAAAAMAAAMLAACGGGGFNDFFSNGTRREPTISLAAAPNPVVRGRTLQLVAAATGDPAVDEVVFFSVGTDDALTRLGSLSTAPFVLSLTVAADATGRLRYQARVTDSNGRSVDSLIVEVLATAE